jgi:DNA-binding MarR family transcriptional regulator
MYKQKLAIFVLVGGARSGATRAAGRRADSNPDVLVRRRGEARQARSIRGGRQPLSTGARIVLERISRIIEANPGADARTIRVRTGFSRDRGDAVLARLLRDGFIERRPANADWPTRRKDR